MFSASGAETARMSRQADRPIAPAGEAEEMQGRGGGATVLPNRRDDSEAEAPKRPRRGMGSLRRNHATGLGTRGGQARGRHPSGAGGGFGTQQCSCPPVGPWPRSSVGAGGKRRPARGSSQLPFVHNHPVRQATFLTRGRSSRERSPKESDFFPAGRSSRLDERLATEPD